MRHMLGILLIALSASGFATAADDAAQQDEILLPDGYRTAAYLDCGVESASGAETGPRITQTRGDAYVFPNTSGPLGTCAFDAGQVEFALAGLDPHAEYVLAFAWWDTDNSGRRQSVRFGLGEPPVWTTVLPATPACAFHADQPTWARALLPLSGEFAGKEKLQVAFALEEGPNAVVSEVRLLEKAAPETRKRVLIVTGDDYAGHLWRETGPELARILREDNRFEVSIAECPAILGSPLLTHYDAVVINFKNYAERLPLGQEIGAAFQAYAAAGHGVVFVHFGCGAFQEWPGFVKTAGRVWNPEKRPHDPRGPFTVNIVDSKHAVTAGLEDFVTTDELYTCLDGATPIQVLCEATSAVDKLRYPMAFIVEGTGGRVFHSVLGHDIEAFSAPGVRELYRRAAAWAAGL